MSITVQQILSDAKRLATRLKDHEWVADGLILEAQGLEKTVDAMKQYQEDCDHLNEIARQRPRAALVLGIAQENRQLRALQQENKELRVMLEEHQSALEMVMSKYRQHIHKLLTINKFDQRGRKTASDTDQVMQERVDKICEMADVMNRAIQADDASAARENEAMTALSIENRGLRELLDISSKHGSLRYGLLGMTTEDKEIQTELGS